MNRLLMILILVAAGCVGLGFYLKWFHVGSESVDDQVHVTVTVDKEKMHQDENKALEKMHDLGHLVKDKTVGPAEKSKDEAAPPAPPLQDQK